MAAQPPARLPDPVPRPEARGKVEIADDVVKQIVGYAVLEAYGVVGMASKNLYRGATHLLSRDSLTQGVEVRRDAEGVHIDLYVVMEYGLNLAEVAANVRSGVRYAVERDTRLRLAGVQIHIQGVKRTETTR
jgi:uncharacterized alkaline shock family protein YloU